MEHEIIHRFFSHSQYREIIELVKNGPVKMERKLVEQIHELIYQHNDPESIIDIVNHQCKRFPNFTYYYGDEYINMTFFNSYYPKKHILTILNDRKFKFAQQYNHDCKIVNSKQLRELISLDDEAAEIAMKCNLSIDLSAMFFRDVLDNLHFWKYAKFFRKINSKTIKKYDIHLIKSDALTDEQIELLYNLDNFDDRNIYQTFHITLLQRRISRLEKLMSK